MRVDEHGDVLWHRRILRDRLLLWAVAVAADGSIYLSGEDGAWMVNEAHVWLMKLTPDGEVEWEVLYRSASVTAIVRDVLPARDGGVFAISSMRFGGVLAKLRETGDLLWQRAWNPSAGLFLHELADGRLLFAGRQLDAVDAPWIGLHDSSGAILSESAVELEAGFHPTCFAVAPDGSSYLGGSVALAGGFWVGWVGRWTADLELDWSRTVTLEGRRTEVNSCAVTSDGGVFVGGGTSRAGGVGPVGRQAWWAKLSSGGGVTWHHFFQQGISGDLDFLIPGPDDGLYLAFEQDRGVSSGRDPLVARVLSDGLPLARCPDYKPGALVFAEGVTTPLVPVSDTWPNDTEVTPLNSTLETLAPASADYCCPHEYRPSELSPPDGDEWLIFTEHRRFNSADPTPANGCLTAVARGYISGLRRGDPPDCMGITDRLRHADGESPGLDEVFYYLVAAVNYAAENPIGPTGYDTLGAERTLGTPCP